MIATRKGNIIRKTIRGKTTEINLTPVEEITNTLEQILKKRTSWKDRSHVKYHLEALEKTKNLDKTQLEYLTSSLFSMVCHYADLYQRVLDNPEKECAQIKEYKDFFDLVEKHSKNIPNLSYELSQNSFS